MNPVAVRIQLRIDQRWEEVTDRMATDSLMPEVILGKLNEMMRGRESTLTRSELELLFQLTRVGAMEAINRQALKAEEKNA